MRLPLVLSQVSFLFSTAAIADTTATISSEFAVTTQGPMSCDTSAFSSPFVDVTTTADDLASFGALNFEVANPGSGIVRAETPAGEEATRGGNTANGTGLAFVSLRSPPTQFGLLENPGRPLLQYSFEPGESGAVTGQMSVSGSFPTGFNFLYSVYGNNDRLISMICRGSGVAKVTFEIDVQQQ